MCREVCCDRIKIKQGGPPRSGWVVLTSSIEGPPFPLRTILSILDMKLGMTQGAGHGETAANRRHAENRMVHQRPDQSRQRVPLRFAQGSVSRKVLCDRRQLEHDGPPLRGLLLPTTSTEGPSIPLREVWAVGLFRLITKQNWGWVRPRGVYHPG